jgi:hypothetical protein
MGDDEARRWTASVSHWIRCADGVRANSQQLDGVRISALLDEPDSQH